MKTTTLKFNFTPTKKEVVDICRTHGISVAFPADSSFGHIFRTSQPDRFQEIIQKYYSTQYKVVSCNDGFIGLIKIKPQK